jgi:sigma-B regulation protein RsbU (phosphoserine phosphatase)
VRLRKSSRQYARLSEGRSNDDGDDAVEFRDLFEDAPCGYLILDTENCILRVNRTLAHWLGFEAQELSSHSLHDVLTTGGQILFESHLAPLLALKGFFDEVSLELKRKSGERLAVMGSAVVIKDRPDQPRTTRIAFIRATERRRYERELVEARAAADTARKKLEISLANEVENSKFREQFIAVLGHDLRNPVAAIDAGASLLLRAELDAKSRKIVGLMQGSVLRMRGLIDNVLDFARARLGDGLSLDIDATKPLQPTLEQVVRELQWIQPGRDIRTTFQLDTAIPADHARLSQLLSNLLGNAITHGAADHPIEVRATAVNGTFELSVSNKGEPISPENQANLFQPFFRGSVRPSQQGLGLGLFISSEIARAHGGALEVKSDEIETRFTFRMTISD